MVMSSSCLVLMSGFIGSSILNTRSTIHTNYNPGKKYWHTFDSHYNNKHSNPPFPPIQSCVLCVRLAMRYATLNGGGGVGSSKPEILHKMRKDVYGNQKWRILLF